MGLLSRTSGGSPPPRSRYLLFLPPPDCVFHSVSFLSFAAMVTTSSLHEVHLRPWYGSKRISRSQDRLVVHDGLRRHHRNAPHLMAHLRREHSVHRHLGCRHGKSHWSWSVAGVDHPVHRRDRHRCGCHGVSGVGPVGAGAHGLGLPSSPSSRLLLHQVAPLQLRLFCWCSPKLQVSDQVC